MMKRQRTLYSPPRQTKKQKPIRPIAFSKPLEHVKEIPPEAKEDNKANSQTQEEKRLAIIDKRLHPNSPPDETTSKNTNSNRSKTITKQTRKKNIDDIQQNEQKEKEFKNILEPQHKLMIERHKLNPNPLLENEVNTKSKNIVEKDLKVEEISGGKKQRTKRTKRRNRRN